MAVDAGGNVFVAELGMHSPDGQILKVPPGQTSTTEQTIREEIDLGELLDVRFGAGRDLPVDDLLGHAPAKSDLDLRFQILS